MSRLAVALVLGLALVGCGGESSDSQPRVAESAPIEPETLTVSGTIEAPIDARSAVKENDPTIDVTPCITTDGYDDIAQGAQVTVRGADGETVGLGTLDQGKIGGEAGDMLITAPCAFPFRINDVPPGQKFYSVEVASRGEVNYSESDLEDPLALSLGD